jgi:phosphoglycolate phosphatase-like HAD superfamily hydrolase
MPHPPILLFDFDGVVITQKALEFTALHYSRKVYFSWKNTESLRLIDYARLFEESDSNNRVKALIQAYKVYKPYISNPLKRILFFIKFRRTYPKYEIYETMKPNLKSILELFNNIDAPLGIVSNTKNSRLLTFRKPHPYPILKILEKVKQKYHFPIEKDRVFFIGDLPTDILCAHNAGIKSIALLNGHGTEKSLRKVNPTYVLRDISEITEIELFKKLLFD